MTNPKKLVIIGAGYSGVLSALLLAKLKDVNGDKIFDITIVESNSEILSGASLIPTRLHLGGEYPLDPVTAKQCLRAAIIFKQILPEDFIFTGQPNVHYMVTQESQRGGEISFDLMVERYEAIKKEYEKHCAELDENGIKKFFGDPQNFYRILEKEEYKEVKGIAGAMQTNEESVNPVRLGTYLEEALKANGVKILRESRVSDIEQNLQDKKWRITTENGFDLTSDCVVNASWQDELRLRLQAMKKENAPEEEKAKVYLRAMAVADISDVNIKKDRAYFVLIGESGFMYSPFNDEIALVYKVGNDAAYVSSVELDAQNLEIPKEWKIKIAKGLPDESQRMKAIADQVGLSFNQLLKFEMVRLPTRPTVSFDRELSQRRDKELETTADKSEVNLSSTKMTYTPFKACQVAHELLQFAEKNGIKADISPQDRQKLSALVKGESVVVPQFCNLQNEVEPDLEFFKKVGVYALNRNLPVAMAIANYDNSEQKAAITTHKMIFVMIYGQNISPLDSFFDNKFGLGTHIHVISNDAMVRAKEKSQRQEAALLSHDLVWAKEDNQNLGKVLDGLRRTIIGHGTIQDLVKGKFASGVSEKMRREKLGGDFGIASHHDRHGQLNDEASVVDNNAYYVDQSGRVEEFGSQDGFSFVQLFNDPKNDEEVYLQDSGFFTDIADLTRELEKKFQGSFVAIFEADIDLSKDYKKGGVLKSRTISGYDKSGEKFPDLKSAWQGWRIINADGHVEQFRNVEVKNLRAGKIERFLIADQNGEIEINGMKYRLADPKHKVDAAAVKIQRAYRKFKKSDYKKLPHNAISVETLNHLNFIVGIDDRQSESFPRFRAEADLPNAKLELSYLNRELVLVFQKYLDQVGIATEIHEDYLTINNVNEKLDLIKAAVFKIYKINQLLEAARKDDLKLVKEIILEDKIDVNAQSPLIISRNHTSEIYNDDDSFLRIRGASALMIAAEQKGSQNKTNKVLKWLLENGADLKAETDVGGWIALHAACANNNIEGAKLLVKYGADIYKKDRIKKWHALDDLEVNAIPNAKAVAEELKQISEERKRVEALIARDKEALVKGHLIVACACPMTDKSDLQKWRDYGFLIDDDWDKNKAHLFIVFFNPKTNKTDVVTGYNSPTEPNFALCRGEGDFLDFEHDDPQLSFERLIKRDLDYLLDPVARMNHKTDSVVMEASHEKRMALAKMLDSARITSRNLQKANDLPLYYLEPLVNHLDPQIFYINPEDAQERSLRQDCQSITFDIFHNALPNDRLILPETLQQTEAMAKKMRATLLKSQKLSRSDIGQELVRYMEELDSKRTKRREEDDAAVAGQVMGQTFAAHLSSGAQNLAEAHLASSSEGAANTAPSNQALNPKKEDGWRGGDEKIHRN